MVDLMNSNYIIDGVQMPLSPARMLRECTVNAPLEPDGDPATVSDEALDPAPDSFTFHGDPVAFSPGKRQSLPLPFSGPFTASKVAQALIDAIWQGGHFRLGDLLLKADWKWNAKSIGLAAAFYYSVEEACNYIDALGVKISRYSLSSGTPAVSFKAGTVADEDLPEDILEEAPVESPRISRRRKCPATIQPDGQDWLLYIPFDTCDFRLGGSTLAESAGASPSTPPDVADADYFMDCYEVVRELVEDGVVKAGVTVGDGGLLTALRSFTTAETGADISIRDICRAYGEELPLRVCFAEVPGVVIQIADIDYDYVDAELILEDVVYFPIGHPETGRGGVRISEKVEIPQILESLLNTLEGED